MKILLLAPESCVLKNFLKDCKHTWEKITPEYASKFDLMVSFGYRYILTKDILDVCPGINLHISYLPYNKGADPNFWSLYDGTPKGVTIHKMDEGIDTGEILLQQLVEFSEDDTLSSSYQKLQDAIVNLFIENAEDLLAGNIKPKPNKGGTYHCSKDKEKIFAILSKKYPNVWKAPIKEVIGIDYGR